MQTGKEYVSLKSANGVFQQQLEIEKPAAPLLLDEGQLNVNAFILPLLIKHPHIEYSPEKDCFIINEDGYQMAQNKEDVRDLQKMEQAIFNRFRLVSIEGLDGKAYAIEELNTETGLVINRTMFLTDNVTSEDISGIKQKINEYGITTVATSTREVGMMFQRNQLDLIKELEINQTHNNQQVHVLNEHGSMRTRFGYICAGLSLLTLKGIIDKDEIVENNKIKNFVIKMKQKAKRKEKVDNIDEIEANGLKINQNHKNSLFSFVNLEQAQPSLNIDDSLTLHIREEAIGLVKDLGGLLNIKVDDIVEQMSNPKYAHIYQNNINPMTSFTDFITEEMDFNQNLRMAYFQEKVSEIGAILEKNELNERMKRKNNDIKLVMNNPFNDKV